MAEPKTDDTHNRKSEGNAFFKRRKRSSLIYREIFLKPQVGYCRWLDDDNAWNELLSLKLDSRWLNNYFHSLTNEELLGISISSSSTRKPLIHKLLQRLVNTLSSDSVLDNTTKTTRTLETLGIVLSGVLFRSFVDFTQDVFSLLCDLSESESFLCKIIASLLTIVEQKAESEVIEYHQRLALGILIVISCASDNIQQNTIIENFTPLHANLWRSLVRIFDSETYTKEEALLLTSIICNFHKHEVRNPFIDTSLLNASVYDIHACMFALESLLSQSLKEIEIEVKNSTKTLPNIIALAEDATSAFLDWGIDFTSTIGAWVAGISETLQEEAKSKRLRLRRTSQQYEVGGLVPVIHHNEAEPKQDKRLSTATWIKARIGLISLYELLCSSGGKRWLEECLLHEVPPWASSDSGRGSRPQPVACPKVILCSLSSLSFFIHSGNPPVALLALNTLRCFVENEMATALFFSSSLENGAQVNSFDVFNRDAKHNLTIVSSCSNKKFPPARLFSQEARNRAVSGSITSSSHQSLAAVIYHMMANLLLDYNSELDLEQDAVSYGTSNNRLGKHHQPGHICLKALEVIHRLLVFEARMLTQEEIHEIGTNWPMVWHSLFAFAKGLCTENAFEDLNLKEKVRVIGKLVHVLNMSQRGRTKEEIAHFYYEVVRYRSMFEDLRKLLEGNKNMASFGGERIAKFDMANIRAIVFHFSSVISVAQNPEQNMTHGVIMKTIESHASSLKLKPIDRMGDAYEEYVETKDEVTSLVLFMRHLLADKKKEHMFYKVVHSQ